MSKPVWREQLWVILAIVIIWLLAFIGLIYLVALIVERVSNGD